MTISQHGQLGILFVFVLFCGLNSSLAEEQDGWKGRAVTELSPTFKRLRVDGKQTLTIESAHRKGAAGAWTKQFPVNGGSFYRFTASRRTNRIESPRRSTLAKITWHDDKGRLVRSVSDDWARPEYPRDGAASDGWTSVTGIYRVPQDATSALVELHLRWTVNGEVQWRDVALVETEEPKPRLVRLAAVHFRPQGQKSAQANLELFGQQIEKAAAKDADLVCLGEAVTKVGTKSNYVEAAEPIPGPSTKYLGSLAKKHDLYIVAGLLERSGKVVYNTAVLVGPHGNLVGKYRKVCLPREEIEGGVSPGTEYPVFNTRFGRLGLMVCWDVQFPEVARNLSVNGAEVIAMPIWGGNATLASARAIENQVFLVSSTYTDAESGGMKSGIWDREGKLLAQGRAWGEVHVVEVDLAKRKYWPWLGDLKARIDRERPLGGFLD